MTLLHGPSGTIDSALLLLHAHGELDPAEETEISNHVSTCDACRDFVSGIRARTSHISDIIASADAIMPAPAAWNDVIADIQTNVKATRRRSHVRIAAGWILAIGVAGAMTSSPVRAWLAEQWHSLGNQTEPVSTSVEAPPIPTEQITPVSALMFEPRTEQLTVTFDAVQESGTLTVRFAEDTLATAAIVNGGGEQLTLGREALRVTNSAASTASFVLTLPLKTTRVNVTIADRATVTMTRDASGKDYTISLDSR